MRALAIVNQKGGCGKTTTAINLSSALSRTAGRVLLIDLDPQGHCGLGLSVPAASLDRQIGDVLMSDLSRPPDLTDLIWQVGDRFDLIPSNVRLAALEAAQGPLVRMGDRDRRLEQLLRYLASRYEWCVIDCPPHVGLLTFNALRACTDVLVPVEASFFSLQGADHLLRTVETVSRRVGRRMSAVLVPTMYDAEIRLGREIHDELKRRYCAMVAPHPIRYCQALRESAGFGRPVHDYAPESKGSADYLALAEWMAQRVRPPVDYTKPARTGPVGPLPCGSGDSQRLPLARLPRMDQAQSSHTGQRVPFVETCETSDWPRRRGQAGDRAAEIAQRARAFAKERRAAELGYSPGEGAGPSGRAQTDASAPRWDGFVTLVYRPTQAVREVVVVGDFGTSAPRRVVMHFSRQQGEYRAQVRLEPGRYRYRIEVDGSPMIDPRNPICESDDNGQMYSVLAVSDRVAVSHG